MGGHKSLNSFSFGHDFWTWPPLSTTLPCINLYLLVYHLLLTVQKETDGLLLTLQQSHFYSLLFVFLRWSFMVCSFMSGLSYCNVCMVCKVLQYLFFSLHGSTTPNISKSIYFHFFIYDTTSLSIISNSSIILNSFLYYLDLCIISRVHPWNHETYLYYLEMKRTLNLNLLTL